MEGNQNTKNLNLILSLLILAVIGVQMLINGVAGAVAAFYPGGG